MRKIIITLFLGSLIAACDDDTNILPYEETLIVEGYLYQGKPVENIKLTKLIPLTGDTDADYSVNDAIVEFLKTL